MTKAFNQRHGQVEDSQSGDRTHFSLSQVLGNSLVAIWVVIVVVPLIWMCLSTFKSSTEMLISPLNWPTAWDFDNFSEAWRNGVKEYTFNSIIVTIPAVFVLFLILSC